MQFLAFWTISVVFNFALFFMNIAINICCKFLEIQYLKKKSSDFL